MRMSAASEQSTTDTAEELLSQLVQENTEMAEELDTTSSTTAGGGGSSRGSRRSSKARAEEARPAAPSRFVIRDLLIRHEHYPRVISLYYACKKLSCNAQEAKVRVRSMWRQPAGGQRRLRRAGGDTDGCLLGA